MVAGAAEVHLGFVSLGFPDGKDWILGKGGLGRPFSVRFVLGNDGEAPIRLWNAKDAEGLRCPSIRLTNTDGKVIVLRPEAPNARSGVPGSVELAPHQTIAIELDLLRMIGTRSLAPGAYRLQGIYENRVTDTAFVKGLWTGEIRSMTETIRIVAPDVR
jgi:hypothetical protein